LTQRIIIHVDFDYFYAQCEEIVHPELRGKPIVVCVYSGRTAESGVVSTSNYEARKYGVKAGIPIAYAKKMLASVQSTFLAMNMRLYEEISSRIMNILRSYGDSFEKVGIDEAYLDLSNMSEGNVDKAKAIVMRIKGEILQKEQVTCSIGVAQNKLLAKMASDYEKPNGLTTLRQEGVTKFIGGLPVSRIPGVGKKVEKKLNEIHVRTIDELAGVDPVCLVEKFGRNLGNYLFQASRGEDNDPVKDREQPLQLSRIATLKENSRDPREILPLLRELSYSVLEKLNDEKMEFKSVSLIVILADLSVHTKSATLESPTTDFETFADFTKTLLERFIESMPDVLIRRVGVRVSGLQRRMGQTNIITFLQA